MTTTTLVTIYCDACGPGGSELGGAETAAAARRQLVGRGWAVNVREPTADRGGPERCGNTGQGLTTQLKPVRRRAVMAVRKRIHLPRSVR